MGLLEGKVAIITGAARGVGFAHARLFAAEGARLVLNDRGGEWDGTGQDTRPAAQAAEAIRQAGGEAVAHFGDVAEAEDARSLIQLALDTYGRLDVLVLNAGILRDRMVFNMTPEDWDAVVRVHLRGHFLPAHYAAAYWRERSKATGQPQNASIILTSSESGIYGNAGQINYAAAKSGIATMAIVLARELERYGVRANAICPRARTRLTEGTFGPIPAPEDFDPWDPATNSPMVAFLASDAARDITGQVFVVGGDTVQWMQSWTVRRQIRKPGAAFTPAELVDRVHDLFGDDATRPARFPSSLSE